jgi:transposase-like protein
VRWTRSSGFGYRGSRWWGRRLTDETAKSAWCREHGLYPQELEQWRQSATQALAAPEEARASRSDTKADRQRIKALERELRRKDKALAEAAALLVLSKKLEAIFQQDKDEDA